jgi:formylglycine-generating enzyme required for sulfatase activity
MFFDFCTQDLEGSIRVLRGGDWGSNPQYCRVSYRRNRDPDSGNINVGFRLILAP